MVIIHLSKLQTSDKDKHSRMIKKSEEMYNDNDNDNDDDDGYLYNLFRFVDQFINDETIVVTTIKDSPNISSKLFTVILTLTLSVGLIILGLYLSGKLINDETATVLLSANGGINESPSEAPSFFDTLKLHIGISLQLTHNFKRTGNSENLNLFLC